MRRLLRKASLLAQFSRSSLRAAGGGSAKHPGVDALVRADFNNQLPVWSRRPHRKLLCSQTFVVTIVTTRKNEEA